jgi:hypothetical protein
VRRGLSVGLVGSLALALVGCGIDDRKPDVSDRVYCDSYFKAVEDRTAACGGTSREALATALMTFDYCDVFAASQEVGAVAIDHAAADACVNEMATAACWEDTPACGHVFVGQLEEGAACYGFYDIGECAPGSYCAGATCPGTCIRHAQVGEACTSGVDPMCDPSLECAAGGTCEPSLPPVMVGDACPPAFCPPLSCVGPDGPLAVADPSHTGTCQLPAASGNPCIFDNDCVGHCVGAAPPTTYGICAPWKQIGDACTPGARECLSGTSCGPDSHCILLPALGESCVGYQGEGTACLNAWCNAGLCVPLGEVGQRCGGTGSFADSCGFLRGCEPQLSICLPTCSRLTTCGGVGQFCCAGQLCARGAVCAGGSCVPG